MSKLLDKIRGDFFPDERCVKAEIKIPKREGFFDCMPAEVIMHFPSYTWKFSFYEDEISFSESELVGLTKDEAIDLHRKKDIAYLQS